MSISDYQIVLPQYASELKGMPADACWLVGFAHNVECRCPAEKIKKLDPASIVNASTACLYAGYINQVVSSAASYRKTRDLLISTCDLSSDGVIAVPSSSSLVAFVEHSCELASAYVRDAHRFSDVTNVIKKRLGRSAVGGDGLQRSKGVAKFDAALNALSSDLCVLLLRPLRNVIEHGSFFVNPININEQTRTFGLAINLESGMLDQALGKGRNKQLVEAIESFCEKRKGQGTEPFVSLGSFVKMIDAFIALQMLSAVSAIESEGAAAFADFWSTCGSREGFPDYGILVEIDKVQRKPSWYISNRLYRIFTVEQFAVASNQLQMLTNDLLRAAVTNFEHRSNLSNYC